MAAEDDLPARARAAARLVGPGTTVDEDHPAHLLERLADELERWRLAAVLMAMPVEAMLIAGADRCHGPDMRRNLAKGVAAVRAAMNGEPVRDD